MKYTILWSESAEKQLKKLDRSIAKQIYRKVGELADDPYRNTKRLVGIEGHRLRVGDYRVIYKVNSNKLEILILKTGHRKNIY
ncbi:MAG: type II toxin-antitoxin system RelE/ParE family toxin [Candidatus Altiarchaeia archaeon]|jgi:mRNA interferase RelE/StbE